jgi:hypothetical protein
MKKTAVQIFFTCLLVLGTSSLQSCKTASILQTSSKNYAKTNPADVEVFMSKKPSKKFIEIGTVTSSKNVGIFSRTQEKTYQELKEKAASIGGDAIINLTEDISQVKGVVIKYTE